MEFREWLENYSGEHHAPGKEDAPMHNLTGAYPDDIYGPDAARLYGDNRGGPEDYASIAIIQNARNRPNFRVQIYRAVPLLTPQEKIANLEKQKKYILKYGRLPPNVNSLYSHSEYYEKISDQIAKLETLPPMSQTTINPGDWVTINRRYAVEHGRGNLGNEFKVLTKTVPASTLYNDGNSIHEWGFNP
jgi:hypothetical protein